MFYKSFSSKHQIKILLWFFIFSIGLSQILFLSNPIHAQGFNVASEYNVTDKEAKNGNIVVNIPSQGITRTNVPYDNRMFGVIQTTPIVVLREASESAAPNTNMQPIIRDGDAFVTVNNYNGDIKNGDYVTTSPQSGIGMKAGQSGYVLGTALENASYGNQTQNIEGKQTKTATIKVALAIQYAELTTARNSISFLNNLNTAFFRSVQNPEKFTLTIRYIIAGIIALLAFTIGFFTVARSVGKATEAIGRNPLAKTTILASVVLQIVITVIGGIATVAIVYIIIRV